MQELPLALAPLAAHKQFIPWILSERDGKQVKLPIDYRTGEVTDAHNPDAWLDAETILPICNHYGHGVGFVFTTADPFFFVDIDKCLEPDNATWSPVAMELLTRLQGAAVEVSQSGRGLHIIGTGTAPEHACKNVPLGLELYTEGRFVALTGTNTLGSVSFNPGDALAMVVRDYYPPKQTTRGDEWTTEAAPEYTGPEDNARMIAQALASSSAAAKFAGKATFADLWENNESVLASCYPDPEGNRVYDSSSADAALAQHLAFWTGCNCERMLELMQLSGLARDKWDRPDYLIRTITRAVTLQGPVYSVVEKNKQPEPERIPVEPTQPLVNLGAPEILEGYQFLAVTQQIEHFKGCVYVQETHRVFTPTGASLKPDQFNATYGGYVFQLDGEASGKTTRKAWDAFTESQAVRYPKAESTCFRPDRPPGELINKEGRILVNSYIPIATKRIKGDPAPFLLHLKKVLPVQHDRDILLAYMAACIQHKGVKFQWAPLLQGAEGNGKTLFTRCVAFAIGEKYTFMPLSSEISEKFNAWLFETLFIGIEDIYVPEHKREVIEILKPMITNTRHARRAMQTDQVMADIVCNFIFNSNHKDAIRKSRTDRRFAMFFTAQQNPGDLERDGMGGDYFPEIYKWLRADGYAIVAEYLESYAIPDELNPATACHRAPETSSSWEAIEASMGGVEQEILEAIGEGRPGFAGGWISSSALDRLLLDTNSARRITRNKRRELLQSLGYDWHPALVDGRVNNHIPFDNGKPRLFIKNGHISANLQIAAEVARVYQEAQNAAASGTSAAASKFSS